MTRALRLFVIMLVLAGCASHRPVTGAMREQAKPQGDAYRSVFAEQQAKKVVKLETPSQPVSAPIKTASGVYHVPAPKEIYGSARPKKSTPIDVAPPTGAPLHTPRSYPELSPLEPIKPLDEKPSSSVSGPYFAPSEPAALPPISAKTETPDAPRVKGQAAPALPKATDTDLGRVNARQVSLDTEHALQRINAERTRKGLKPLAMNSHLNQIAIRHARDLAAREEVTAQSRSGHGIGIRLVEQGYTPTLAASVVAGGYTSYDAAIQKWLSNPEEASRLLLPEANEIGFGFIDEPGSRYRTYIEVIIARR